MDHDALKLGGILAPLIISYLLPYERHIINRLLPHAQLINADPVFSMSMDTAIESGCVLIVDHRSRLAITISYTYVDTAIRCKQYDVMRVLRKHMGYYNYIVACNMRDEIAFQILIDNNVKTTNELWYWAAKTQNINIFCALRTKCKPNYTSVFGIAMQHTKVDMDYLKFLMASNQVDRARIMISGPPSAVTQYFGLYESSKCVVS